MARVAVIAGPSLRKNLKAGRAAGKVVDYEFFGPRDLPDADLRRFDGALVELGPNGQARQTLKVFRERRPRKPVGSVSIRCNADVLRRSFRLGFDFHLGS